MYIFNKYSWLLAIVYAVAAFTMEAHSYTSSLEGTYFSAPIITMMIFWSEMTTNAINMDDYKITKKEAFKRDLFLITFGFVLAFTLPLVFEYNNSDVEGWWPIIILIGCLYGLIYAFIFSLIALLADHHKKQTICFVVLIILLIAIENLLPRDTIPRFTSVLFFGEIEFFHLIMGIVLGVYLLLCLAQRAWK